MSVVIKHCYLSIIIYNGYQELAMDKKELREIFLLSPNLDSNFDKALFKKIIFFQLKFKV